ncbi:MAG TPA: hypothetical protein VFM46_01655, partial [Pseudomonadales bacterium]|nr:hypothetical protein [Pseudomonadales bacterium]
PFAYRVLTPWLIREAVDAIPPSVVSKMNITKDGEPRRLEAMERTRWNGHSIPVFVVSYLLVWLLNFSLLYNWRALFKAYGFSPAMSDLAPALSALIVQILFAKSGYIYDYPELLFFSLGLLLFKQQKWLAYYLVFALAVLNKETALLMGAYFVPFLFGQTRRFVSHAAIHALIALPILFVIRWWLRERAGVEAEFHLFNNLRFLASSEPWFKFVGVFAYQLPSPRGFNFLNILIFVLPVWWCRKIIDKALLYPFLIMLLCLFPLFIVFGNTDEFRVFVPAVPVFMLLYAKTIQQLFKQHYAKSAKADYEVTHE